MAKDHKKPESEDDEVSTEEEEKDADESGDADDDADEDDDGDDEDDADDDDDADEVPRARQRVAARRARRRVVKKRGSPTRNIILFVILVGGLAVMFAVFGSSGGGGMPVPSVDWKIGQTVNVEVTLVTTDWDDLRCGMQGEIKGLYCAFLAQNKQNPKSKNNPREEQELLQPFTTTDRVQFMGAGLWMTPALVAKLEKENFDRPSPRFSATCKFTVEGRTKTAFVQWKPGTGWHDGNGWYVGRVKDCKIQ